MPEMTREAYTHAMQRHAALLELRLSTAHRMAADMLRRAQSPDEVLTSADVERELLRLLAVLECRAGLSPAMVSEDY